MILICPICKKSFKTYQSRKDKKYCSLKCYSVIRNKALSKLGKNTRFKKGHIVSKNRILPTDEKHFAWKGNNVSYRGLHQWIIRKKGYANTCSHCGKKSDNHRDIQWANIDHKYRRVLDDYIPLCKNCHIEYDKNL